MFTGIIDQNMNTLLQYFLFMEECFKKVLIATCIQMGWLLVWSDNLLGIYNRAKPIMLLADLF